VSDCHQVILTCCHEGRESHGRAYDSQLYILLASLHALCCTLSLPAARLRQKEDKCNLQNMLKGCAHSRPAKFSSRTYFLQNRKKSRRFLNKIAQNATVAKLENIVAFFISKSRQIALPGNPASE